MVSIAAGTVNSRPMMYNASRPASGVSISDGAVNNADILDFKDPKYSEQYNSACRDLADLKRVEKGLNNPGTMDHDVKGKIDEVCDFYAGNTFAKVQKVGLATFVASALPFIPLFMTAGPVAAAAGSLAVGAVGTLIFYCATRRVGNSWLMKRISESVIAEARKSIGSDVSACEAKLREIRENASKHAIETVTAPMNQPEAIAAEKDTLQDESDCVVIGGIKLNKHFDGSQDKKGDLVRFLKSSVCHLA
jgi:hypothetical protein